MELFLRIRKYENLHIVFWLVKDTCWMLGWRPLGVLMILPTVLIAIFLITKTWRHPELYINAAVLSWIVANSYWMIAEFFFENLPIEISAIPFVLGMIFVAVYYVRPRKTESEDTTTGGVPGGLG